MFMMDKFVVSGGNALKGTVRISGAKNAVLPMMACSFLAEGAHRAASNKRLIFSSETSLFENATRLLLFKIALFNLNVILYFSKCSN